MSFVIHNLGDWERDPLDTCSERSGGHVATYHELSDIPYEVERRQFEWMLENGELVTQIGNMIYQIRRD